MNKGRLIIISGPSGSGKDTIIKKVLSRLPEVKFSISSITRPMREGEVEGEKYNFVSSEYFEDMIKNNLLLEYNNYIGNYYGTPRKPIDDAIENGEEIIIEVDTNGAANIRKLVDGTISVFIMPPSFEELRRRLSSRATDSQEVIEKRMRSAIEEISCAKDYDYIVINDDLDTAVDDFIDVIKADRLKTERKNYLIDEVLQKC